MFLVDWWYSALASLGRYSYINDIRQSRLTTSVVRENSENEFNAFDSKQQLTHKQRLVLRSPFISALIWLFAHFFKKY